MKYPILSTAVVLLLSVFSFACEKETVNPNFQHVVIEPPAQSPTPVPTPKPTPAQALVVLEAQCEHDTPPESTGEAAEWIQVTAQITGDPDTKYGLVLGMGSFRMKQLEFIDEDGTVIHRITPKNGAQDLLGPESGSNGYWGYLTPPGRFNLGSGCFESYTPWGTQENCNPARGYFAPGLNTHTYEPGPFKVGKNYTVKVTLPDGSTLSATCKVPLNHGRHYTYNATSKASPGLIAVVESDAKFYSGPNYTGPGVHP